MFAAWLIGIVTLPWQWWRDWRERRKSSSEESERPHP
jgi:hypothetical protein